MSAPTPTTPQAANARRHASRATSSGALVYHAEPTNAPFVDLLGLRPNNMSGRNHNGASCSCPVLSTEPAATWNRNCPPPPAPDQPRAWGVLHR